MYILLGNKYENNDTIVNFDLPADFNTYKSTALNFKRTDGDIKVWGYGFKSSGTYQKNNIRILW